MINVTIKTLRRLLTCILLSLAMAGASAQVVTFPDSVFLSNSRPVIFRVSKTTVSRADSLWLADTLRLQLDSLGENGLILGRAAASPEGPRSLNKRLAQRRQEAANAVLARMGFDTSRIIYDVVAEDYPMLLALMKKNADPAYPIIDSLHSHYFDDPIRLKLEMQKVDRGKLWKRLLSQYYPVLRAVRLMPIDSDVYYKSAFAHINPYETPTFEVLPQEVGIAPLPAEADVVVSGDEPDHRIPFLGVRTNLLYDLFYMPRFGFAPMWNVGLEYYPRRGHFTYGAWFMSPYYQKWEQYKFFQIRNYELEARYYFRGTDRADYRGWYVSLAIDANKYAIGLGKRDGWQGIGYGAQATVGYVLPLSADHAWKLHFALGLGFYQTNYDPYLYGTPDFFGHEEDDKYYYDTTLDRDNFVKRQHRYRWMGPTQLAVSLSYDLLWRRGTSQKKHRGGLGHQGISFRHQETH